MKAFNDIIAFIVEIVMLAALCIAGYQLATTPSLKYTLAIVLPALVIILWSIWAAPKAKRRLQFPWLSVFKIVLFFITALLLFITGHRVAAIVFGAVAYFNEINTPVIK
jgi:Protein of unknown function (DUF2568)